MKNIKKTKSLLSEKIIAEYEAILSSIGDHLMGLVVVDKKGKILRINKGFKTLTGWEEKEVIGKFLVRIIPRVDKNNQRVPFKKRILSETLSGKILTTSTSASVVKEKIGEILEKISTLYYVRKDKSVFPASSVISPILFNKEITGAVEVFYDITKEKELEQIRTDFLSFASHQLRTPLSGTKWLIETMYNRGIFREITKKQKEYLDDIYKINEQMIGLVSDILSTLRLESEETFVKKEKIPVASILKDVLLRVNAVAKKKELKLRNSLSRETLIVETDSEILKSILGCFLSNAIDYSKIGKEVFLDVKEESGMAVFCVRDFGIGVPKREQKRLFERFYRASNAKNLKPNGTGVGLNIAKMLAGKVGAEISFKSQENKGTTFCLRVPKWSEGRGNEEQKLKI